MTSAVKATRIVLVDLPPMLRDIVRGAVTAESDMEVIGEFDAATEFMDALGRADVIIAGAHEPEGEAFPAAVLSASPGAKVVMLAVAAPAAAIHEVLHRKTTLGDLSPAGLVHAIRAALGPKQDTP